MQVLFLTGVWLGFLTGTAAMYLLMVFARRRRSQEQAHSAPAECLGQCELQAAVLAGGDVIAHSPGIHVGRLEAEKSDLQSRLDQAQTLLSQQAAEIVNSHRAARTDPLTQVANRRVFDEELAKNLSHPRSYDQSVGVILLDVDHFKRLNDQHGHLAGDTVLKQLAHLLQESVPEGHLLARLGGEEFAVLAPAMGLAECCQAAEALRQAVERAIFSHNDVWLRMTLSCGTAMATPRESADSLLARCDQSLYAAKSAGRNAVFFHDGYRCDRYAAASLSTDAHDVELMQLAQEFQAVCHDLKSRLQQVGAHQQPPVAMAHDLPAEVWV
jgi:diguanylate cyclase (GGDEF)-like protein